MFDIKILRKNLAEVKAKLEHRGEDLTDLDKFSTLDQKRRQLIVESEQLKKKRNDVSEQIAILKKEKKIPTILLQKCAK